MTEEKNLATQIIEAAETEHGCRFDENGFDNNAMIPIIGAIVRLMGKAPQGCTQKDDFVIGALTKYRMSPEYARRQAAMGSFVDMMVNTGLSPDELLGVFDDKKGNGHE